MYGIDDLITLNPKMYNILRFNLVNILQNKSLFLERVGSTFIASCFAFSICNLISKYVEDIKIHVIYSI